jgi:capsular polysaccharide transport system permease protein
MNDVQQDSTPRAQCAAAGAARRRRRHRGARSLRVQNALILREIATRYGRTPGGFLWAFWSPWRPFSC